VQQRAAEKEERPGLPARPGASVAVISSAAATAAIESLAPTRAKGEASIRPILAAM